MKLYRVRNKLLCWFKYERYEHPYHLQVSHYLTIAGRTFYWSSNG